MTFEASRLMVLAMTAPQPSMKALAMTFRLVPGGPEAMMNGLGNFSPSTVVASVGISLASNSATLRQCIGAGGLVPEQLLAGDAPAHEWTHFCKRPWTRQKQAWPRVEFPSAPCWCAMEISLAAAIINASKKAA